ncbi:hypothetical protein [Streptomyces sp. RP5T]|uniref:hypothetical protein n=1 Tax=Streptomyces sp. RP5T TaxID=2490848 RepID=UPI000F64A411|nr:hypothetical protein [Streptomyces sp. RP5T]RRR86549.1 hypothetical protein EHS43_04020 [Streptomyces sp. RP5T]
MHDGGHVDASGPLVPEAKHPDRASAIDVVASAAARLGRPVRAKATEADGTVWHLVIAPDGTVGELSGDEQQRIRPPKRRTEKNDRAGSKAAEPVAPHLPTRTDQGADTFASALVQQVDPTDAASHRTGGATVAASEAEAMPASSSQLGPATASARPETGMIKAEAGTYAHSLALVTDLLEGGRVDEAGALAARLDDQAADVLGVSHPDALRIREIRARVTALTGDAVAGVQLFRDVAERWHYQGYAEQAEAAATRAETLWLQITDLASALSAGIAMVRLRNQIPGQDGQALAAALEHQASLEAATGAPGGAGLRKNTPDIPSAPARVQPPALYWERPAQEPRTTA